MRKTLTRQPRKLLLKVLDDELLLVEFSLEVGNTVLEIGDLLLHLSGGQFLLGLLLDLLDLKGLVLGGNVARLEGDELGVSVLAGNPLVGGQGSNFSGGLREEIVLEEVRLTGDLEGDGLNGGGSGLQHNLNLALTDVASQLGENTHTDLGGGGFVLGEVVEVGGLIDHLEVTDVTVTLTGEVEHAGVVVVERHQLTGSGVNPLVAQVSREVTGIPDAELTLRELGHTNSHECALGAQPQAAGTLGTLMGGQGLGDGARARIDDASLLVLAGSSHDGTIVVPGDGTDVVGVASNVGDDLARVDIPDLDGVVSGGGGEDVVGGRVPVDGSDLTTVTLQGLGSVGGLGVLGKTTVGDGPDVTVTVLTTRGNDGGVEGVEVDVEDSGLVPADKGVPRLDLSGGVAVEDDELSTTSSFPVHGDVFGGGRDLVGVPSGLGDTQVLEHELILGASAEDVAVFRGSDKPSHHLN